MLNRYQKANFCFQSSFHDEKNETPAFAVVISGCLLKAQLLTQLSRQLGREPQTLKGPQRPRVAFVAITGTLIMCIAKAQLKTEMVEGLKMNSAFISNLRTLQRSPVSKSSLNTFNNSADILLTCCILLNIFSYESMQVIINYLTHKGGCSLPY